MRHVPICSIAVAAVLKKKLFPHRFTLDIPSIPDYEVDVSDLKEEFSSMTSKLTDRATPPTKEVSA